MTDGADRIYEQVLLLRCQAGDGDAFAELIERYGPRLRLLAKVDGRSHLLWRCDIRRSNTHTACFCRNDGSPD